MTTNPNQVNMTTNTTTMEEMLAACTTKHTNWNSDEYSLTLCRDLDDCQGTVMPLAHVLKGGGVPALSGYFPGQRLYLLPHFNENTPNFRKNVLMTMLQEEAQKHGFDVISKGWDNSDRHNRLRIVCSRKLLYQNSSKYKGIKGQYNCTSRKATSKQETCSFHFSLQWEPDQHRWYLRYLETAGDTNHQGHHRMESSSCKTHIDSLNSSDREMFDVLAKCNLPPSLIEMVIEMKTGKSITDSQIQQAKRDCADAMINTEDGSKATTSAERLVNYLKSDPMISYVIVYGESTGWMSRKVRTVHRLTGQLAVRDQPGESETVGFADSGDNAEAGEHIELLQKATNRSTIKVLLGAALVRDSSLLNYRMFPEVLCGDTTHKTNISKYWWDCGKSCKSSSKASARNNIHLFERKES